MSFPKYSKVRRSGETFSLFLSFLILLILALNIYEFDASLLLVILVIQLLYILLNQKQIMGNSILVTKHQFPDLFSIVNDNAEELGIDVPSVFVSQDPYINAFTIGFKKPYTIILTSALVESFTRDELDFVIGHEMAHIAFGHARYISFISPLGKDIPFVSWIYGDWQRRAEYTADRVGYLLTHNVQPAISSMLKMSVGSKLSQIVNIDELISQIREGKNGFFSSAGEFLLSHPYTTNRIDGLIEYSSTVSLTEK